MMGNLQPLSSGIQPNAPIYVRSGLVKVLAGYAGGLTQEIVDLIQDRLDLYNLGIDVLHGDRLFPLFQKEFVIHNTCKIVDSCKERTPYRLYFPKKEVIRSFIKVKIQGEVQAFLRLTSIASHLVWMNNEPLQVAEAERIFREMVSMGGVALRQTNKRLIRVKDFDPELEEITIRRRGFVLDEARWLVDRTSLLDLWRAAQKLESSLAKLELNHGNR